MHVQAAGMTEDDTRCEGIDDVGADEAFAARDGFAVFLQAGPEEGECFADEVFVYIEVSVEVFDAEANDFAA